MNWNLAYQIGLGIFAIALISFLWFKGLYNHLIKLRNQVRTDLSDIDVQLKRKADLADRLVDMVKEYAKHEQSTFTQVAEARSAVSRATGVKDTAKAENMLSETLRSLMMVVESYPKLLANESFQGLREDLKDIENRIAGYREGYNKSVQDYNNAFMVFPNVLAAKMLGFVEGQLFEA